MLPHVIITRSYCSHARLLPLLSWRGSGQGQTGHAGKAETEYYHRGESCFMLLRTQPVEQLMGPSSKRRDSFLEKSETNSYKSISFSVCFLSELCLLLNFTHILPAVYTSQSFDCLTPPAHLSMAIERSISHFTTSYTFLCHSWLPSHSNGKLVQQRRPRGTCLSLPFTDTHTQIHRTWTVCAAALLGAWRVLCAHPSANPWVLKIPSVNAASFLKGGIHTALKYWCQKGTWRTPTFWPLLRRG